MDKLCSFLCARLEKIKIIKICSYFMRMRLSEKVWMYFTFHIQIYKLSHPKLFHLYGWSNIIGEMFLPLTPCILWCRLLNMLVHNNFMYVQFDDNNVLTRNCVCVCVCLWSANPTFKNNLHYTVEQCYNFTTLFALLYYLVESAVGW